MYDAIVVGGGPAGLSAALVLGRCRRRVLVCDGGEQRNRWSPHMHGYLTRDGIPPAEFLQLARAEVQSYGVEIRDIQVERAGRKGENFGVELADGSRHNARRLLVATGVVDQIPDLAGIMDFYGTSVHHCPYCDGWENKDRRIAVYSRKGAGAALCLRTWSADVVLCSNGPIELEPDEQAQIDRLGISVRQESIERLEGREGRLERIVFRGGESLQRDALFFSSGQFQGCRVARDIGCKFNEKGTVETDLLAHTNVKGVYVAGDAAKDVQMVIVAAAEGAKAAIAINSSLQEEDQGC